MRFAIALGLAALAAGSLTACNDGSSGTAGNNSTVPGTLLESPPIRVASLNSTDLAAQLGASSQGQQLLAIAGAPTCGIDLHYFQYATVGAVGESTTASGALMVPTGSAANCTGPRPVLVYTHGTAATHSYNIANILDSTNEAWQESALIAAMYAAQGYIVVASNYAGYDSSSLPYHPYLNADQQSKDVINALYAARIALTTVPAGASVTDNGKLFVTGYSQGGHVAMATHRAMEARGITVTASSPMSGPYAMVALFDAVLFGDVGLGATVYGPLTIESYQRAYGNIYYLTGQPNDIYEDAFATGIDTLLPGALTPAQLFAAGKLPEFALFNSTTPVTGNSGLDAALAVPSNPLFALGFGSPNLIKNQLRVDYAMDALAHPDGTASAGVLPATNPAFPLRQALLANDLRNWTPMAPTLLCGGHDDPDVLYAANTSVMQGFWSGLPSGLVTVLDVDPGQPAAAGGIAAQIGTIAATVFAYDVANSVQDPAVIAADIQAAIVVGSVETGASPFAAYFTSGVPNSPQGVEVAGLAGVAGQAFVQYFAGGVITLASNPTDVATNEANAIYAYYHFPITQTACEVAARGFFANF